MPLSQVATYDKRLVIKALKYIKKKTPFFVINSGKIRRKISPIQIKKSHNIPLYGFYHNNCSNETTSEKLYYNKRIKKKKFITFAIKFNLIISKN